MAPPDNLAIPQGSTVLVTGVNGFVGSHIADQFLHYGFNVRGTVRNVAKSHWMLAHFEETYGQGRFDLVAVPDIAAERALDDAVKGGLRRSSSIQHHDLHVIIRRIGSRSRCIQPQFQPRSQSSDPRCGRGSRQHPQVGVQRTQRQALHPDLDQRFVCTSRRSRTVADNHAQHLE
jgi:hypothetical protein